MSETILRIDGSQGEGGGQILRSSLSLSACLNRPFEIYNIRAGRKKPGLLRQHLTCVQAAQRICHAQVEGAELGSQCIRFSPNAIAGGEFHFAIGTAGSTSLVLQTILIPLLLADDSSLVIIEGGTHNPAAPSYEFLQRSFLPILRKMGADIEIDLLKAGFYPAGGGKIRASIQPCAQLKPIALETRGELLKKAATATVVGLSAEIAQRELKIIKKKLAIEPAHLHIEESKSRGPGNVVSVLVESQGISEVFTAHGERGVRAETVAKKLCKEVLAYLSRDVPVGEHLADQLLLPIYLAKQGHFHTVDPSLHTLTNAQIIALFTGHTFELQQIKKNKHLVKFHY